MIQKSTSAVFCPDLSILDVFIATSKSNIEVFSMHVHYTTGSLSARGERVVDLITDLFKVYRVATDIKFVASVEIF